MRRTMLSAGPVSEPVGERSSPSRRSSGRRQARLPSRMEGSPVVILCGGRGTRLQEHTQSIPKPLVEIGGRPIVWHVVQLYTSHRLRDIVLACDYRGDMIEAFVESCYWPEGVSVRCVDTGLDTPTGGRIKRLAQQLGERRFCATYGDGLADV